MCGRFTLAISPEELLAAFPEIGDSAARLQPRYNIAPTQPVAVIPNLAPRRLDHFLWGLIPSWSKDPKMGSRLINARAETIAEKPSFRSAFKRRRCLIPATGFYEWQKTPGQSAKTPMYIQQKSGLPLAFAGLWEDWRAADGSQVLSCTIITTTPNSLMAPIHNRMPVILPPAAYDDWLAPGEVEKGQLLSLLQPFPAEELKAYPVSTLVNSPANDLPACILPA